MKRKDYCFELEFRVRDYEVDGEGIVNNANYLHYMEHTRHVFCEEAGLSFAEMIERGLTPVVRKAELTYHSSLHMRDRFVSRLAVRREGPRFLFYQDIYALPDERLAVSGVVTTVCTRDGRPTRGDELAEAFKKYL